MEPPRKRQRLAANTIPDPDLNLRRARNDNRLKSIFESIFDKYGKDFEGIGDEIDLRTGEIVVNNGHILGIKSQTDTGRARNAAGGLYEEFVSDEEGAGYPTDGEEGATPDDGSLMSEAETALQALYVVDSLIDNAAIEPPISLEQSLVEQKADYDSEEDELADRTIEWVTPREAQALSNKKWKLPECGPTFTDEAIIEEAWRTPLIPPSIPLSRDKDHSVSLTSTNKLPSDTSKPSTHEVSPEMLPNPTLPTPSSSSALTLPEAENSPNINSSAGSRKCVKVPWAREEEDLLRHIKSTTDLSYSKMEHLFPRRNKESIWSKWNHLVRRGNSVTKSLQQDARGLSSPSLDPKNAQSALRSGEKTDQQIKSSPRLSNEEGPTNGVETVELSSNTAEQPVETSAIRGNSQLVDIFGSSSLRRMATQPMVTRLQESFKETPSLRHSPRLRDAVGVRRKHSTATFGAEQSETLPLAGSLPIHRSKRSSISDERSSFEPAENLLHPTPSKSQPQDAVILDDVQASDNPALHHRKMSRHPVLGNAQQAVSAPIRVRSPERTPAQRNGLNARNPVNKVTVQVVIQAPRMCKISAPADLQATEREEEPSRELSSASKSSLKSPELRFPLHEGLRRAEVRDSQSANSSQLAERDQDARPALADQPTNCDSPTSSPLRRKLDGQGATDITTDEDLIDELSILCQPSKKQACNSACPVIDRAQSSNLKATAVHRCRKKMDRKVFKTVIADSVSSAASDPYDCSEDELSFM